MDHTQPARQLASRSLGWFPDDPLTPGRRHRGRREAAAERRFLSPHDSSAPSIPERWRLIVRGKVQGVGYREGCRQCAQDLRLSGWVRNLPDGTVEVEAEGRPQDLATLVLWCERGPLPATVFSVHTRRIAPVGGDWFEIRR
jgi:acylphosphatase